MSTVRLFREDPYLLDFTARVLERRRHQGRPAVVLDRTAFYAESGGQPSDAGTLGGVPVTAVIDEGAAVLHVLERELDSDDVQGQVDGRRRRDHRQQHHGQHLLSRALLETHGARTVSFHLGSQASTVDLDREVAEAAVREALIRANEVVWEARPVTVRVVSRAEALRLGLQPAEEAGDAVRLVEAAGFDLQPCGGTHPRSTAEVGVIAVSALERYKGGTRVQFLCGHRVLEAFAARTGVLDRLGRLLSAPFDKLEEAAGRTLQETAALRESGEALQARLVTLEAERLWSAAAPAAVRVVSAAYHDWAPAQLRLLATELGRLGPGVALLGSRQGGKAHLLFAQTEGAGQDIPALLRQAVEAVGGRGGGRGNMAQGGGDRVEALAEALAAAERQVRGGA